MGLAEFYKNQAATHARESILKHRTISDLKHAAAARGYALEVYTSDVDHDGYDVALDDFDTIRKLQFKSVLVGGATSNWGVHRKLLRPQPHSVELFGYETSPVGSGQGGGVVLQEFNSAKEEVSVVYSYCYIHTLCALEFDVFDLHHKTKAKLRTFGPPFRLTLAARLRFHAGSFFVRDPHRRGASSTSTPRQVRSARRESDPLDETIQASGLRWPFVAPRYASMSMSMSMSMGDEHE
jgi:hypothetical protein